MREDFKLLVKVSANMTAEETSHEVCVPVVWAIYSVNYKNRTLLIIENH